MKMISPDQIKKISTLITRQNLTEMKDSLVHQFTSGNTTSRKEMTMSEARDLIEYLTKDDPDTRMRNKIIAICHNMGWCWKGAHDVNRMIIDHFLMSRGVVKKELSRLNTIELVKVVTQFEQIQTKKEIKEQIAEMLKELKIDFSNKKQV